MIKTNHGNSAVMPQAKTKHNVPPLKLRPLSPDHPLNDPTPTWARTVTDAMLKLMCRMATVAKREATQNASPTGWYGVTVLVNAEGHMLCDKDAVPIVVPAPSNVMALDLVNNAVVFP